jgi:hypothetical protein
MTYNATYLLLTILSYVSVFLPLTLLLFSSRLNSILILLSSYLLVSVICESISFYLVKVLHVSNENIFHLFSILEVILLVEIYLLELKYTKLQILSPLIGLLSYGVMRWQFPQLFFILELTGAILLIFFACFYFFRVLDSLEVAVLSKHYFFWINAAIVFYFGLTVFLSGFDRFIRTASLQVSTLLWMIQLSANIIFHSLLAIGIWKWNHK